MEEGEQQSDRKVPALIRFNVAASPDRTVAQPLLTAAIKTEVKCPIPVLAVGGIGEPWRGREAAVTPSSLDATGGNLFPPSQGSLTDEEKFQVEVNRWEEYYDQMHSYLLLDKKINGHVNKNVSKAAANFSVDQSGTMYYSKLTKDGTRSIRVVVIRSYAERVKVCRDIHLDTGDLTLHNRRDKMLEIVGCRYYWKGQRRDICQCVSTL